MVQNLVLKSQNEKDNRISSEDLAAIIIDAFLDVQILRKEDVVKALEIATDKINGRKELGDY